VRRAGSVPGDEEGRIGLVVLLGLVGGAVGVPIGALVASLLWDVICSVGPPGSHGERCGLEGLLFFLVGVPVGAVVGAVTGAVVGSRLSRSRVASPPAENPQEHGRADPAP
jgi:hypothetical protein